MSDLEVAPTAWFLELGASTDLELASFELERVVRVDLEASDPAHPPELLDFLSALAERCERELPPSG